MFLMNSKKNKIILAVSLIIIFLALFSFYYFFRKDRGIDGFYRLTKEDPLFYSSFYQTEKIEKSLNLLEESEKELKNFTMSLTIDNEHLLDERTKSFITSFNEINLYPISFFRLLTPINNLTNEFLENPTVEKAEQLIDLYDQATDKYIENVSSKIELLNNYPGTQIRFLLSFDNTTNVDVVKNDLEIIRRNGYELKNEIQKRRECLHGLLPCMSLAKSPGEITTTNLITESLNFNENEDLNDQERVNFNLIRRILNEETDRLKGPYKLTSNCWTKRGVDDNSQWVFLSYHSWDNYGDYVFPSIATRSIYEERRDADENVIIRPINELLTYRCNDLAFYPLILTMDFLIDKMITENLNIDELTNSPEYKSLLLNQFGLISPAINTLSRNQRTIILFWQQQGIDERIIIPIIEGMIPLRSAYSMLYLPYSHSTWRIDETLNFFSQDEVVANIGTRYDLISLREKGYSDEEIIELHRLSSIFWEELWERMSID